MFAEASDEFAEYNASVIGVSTDDIDTLNKFSVEECRNKFAVAADPEGTVVENYDAGLTMMPGLAGRISFVVVPGGEIIHVLDEMRPEGHIEESLAAVKAWASTHTSAGDEDHSEADYY